MVILLSDELERQPTVHTSHLRVALLQLFQLHPFLNVGQLVRIRGGCLDGIEGILTAINGTKSLVVSVQLIERSIVMQISGYQVEPVGSSKVSLDPGKVTPRRETFLATCGKEI